MEIIIWIVKLIKDKNVSSGNEEAGDLCAMEWWWQFHVEQPMWWCSECTAHDLFLYPSPPSKWIDPRELLWLHVSNHHLGGHREIAWSVRKSRWRQRVRRPLPPLGHQTSWPITAKWWNPVHVWKARGSEVDGVTLPDPTRPRHIFLFHCLMNFCSPWVFQHSTPQLT